MPSVGAYSDAPVGSGPTGRPRATRPSAAPRPRARRRSGPSLVIRGLVLLGLLLVLIAVTAVGATGFVAVSSIATLSQDLPDPEALVDALVRRADARLRPDREGASSLASSAPRARSSTTARSRALVLDATTTAEDRTFWANDGYDVQAMVAAAIETLQGDGRGASTITQQLVRARLLPGRRRRARRRPRTCARRRRSSSRPA